MDLRKSLHLRLIKSDSRYQQDKSLYDDTDMVQADLFPMAKPELLIFMDASELSADYFIDLIDEARPTYVLDVRPTPHFNIGRLNRRKVFETFERTHTQYIDVTGIVGVSSRWDANLNPSFLINTINSSLQHCVTDSVEGPIVVLCDNKEFLNSAMEIFPKLLLKNEKQQWQVYLPSVRS